MAAPSSAHESMDAMMMNQQQHPEAQQHAFLNDSLASIPRHEKLEYLQALRVAPHIVANESDPLSFLRYCRWDADAAARRLTVYWRKRTNVFGERRWSCNFRS